MPPKRKLEVELYKSIETGIQEAIDVVEAKKINYLQADSTTKGKLEVSSSLALALFQPFGALTKQPSKYPSSPFSADVHELAHQRASSLEKSLRPVWSDNGWLGIGVFMRTREDRIRTARNHLLASTSQSHPNDQDRGKLRVPDLLKAFYYFLVGHSSMVDRSISLVVFVVEVRTPAQQQRGLAFPPLSSRTSTAS
jgi:hypothetical protein